MRSNVIVLPEPDIDDGLCLMNRTIRLAFLAPDFVESIFKGNASENLTVDHLLRLPDFPVEWRNQREVLQFI